MATATKTKPKNERMDPSTGEIVTMPGVGVLTTSDLEAYGADAGAGFENQTSEDVSIPFLVVLQPGSPEVQGEEAIGRAGMIMNRATGEMFSGKEGISFIPSTTQHLMVEWTPRDKGGGFQGSHAVDSDLAKRVRNSQALGAYVHPDNGNDLIETFYVYGLVLDKDGIGQPAVIACSSTHIRAYKDWMYRARSVVIPLPEGRRLTNLPLFSHAYRIRTERQEKNGNTWFIPQVNWAGDSAPDSRLHPSSDLYQAAKALREAVSTGARKADTSGLGAAETGNVLSGRTTPDGEGAPY